MAWSNKSEKTLAEVNELDVYKDIISKTREWEGYNSDFFGTCNWKWVWKKKNWVFEEWWLNMD